MSVSYDEGVALVKQCWAAKGTVKCCGKSAAYNALRLYLQNKSIPYSHEEALKWIDENRNKWTRSKFMQSRRAVFELNDVMTTGKIKDGDYNYSHDPIDDLSDYWQEKVCEYIDFLKTIRSESAIRTQRNHCISFAGFLTQNDIRSAEGITCLVISKYHDFAETVGDTYTSIYSIRFFLQFLVDQGLLPRHRPYALTSPLQAKAIGYAMESISNEAVLDIESGIIPEDFFSSSDEVVKYLSREYEYDPTALRNNYTVFFQMYYVFCCENGLLCSYASESQWLSIMSGFWKYYQQPHSALRAFYMYHIYQAKGEISISDIKNYDIDRLPALFKQDRPTLSAPVQKRGNIEKLSEHYGELLDKFLKSRRLESISKSTLKSNKQAAISFFIYLQDHGYENILDVTYMTVKEYCVWISGRSTNKRNNYAYGDRVLLQFLFEAEYTIFDLSRALPMQSLQVRKIVEVLSQDEVAQIYEFRDKAETQQELRDSAFLMLGLLMGLRRIDIVNLKQSDIDWTNRTISITQQKTYRPLVLPMPVPVGNSIYKYMKYARPKVDSEFIFISVLAPYKQAHTSACGKAMEHALPGRGKGFHILRRTFASRLLLAGTDATRIKDALGQSTMNTVNRYLSVDEKALKACCLPLERTVVQNETTA